MNELFRRTGEPTYHTPIAVIGELVNQQGGQVTIINQPFRSQPRVWRKGWAKKFKFGRLYFYISNCRMKKRPIRDLMYDGAAQDHVIENKHKLYERQGGKCPHCGQPFDYESTGIAPHPTSRTIPRTWAVYPQRHHALPQVSQGNPLQPVEEHRNDEGESGGIRN